MTMLDLQETCPVEWESTLARIRVRQTIEEAGRQELAGFREFCEGQRRSMAAQWRELCKRNTRAIQEARGQSGG